MSKSSRVVLAACDGACSGNPGPGGWGALLKFEDGSVKEMGGYAPATTNNRMELTAALELMRALEDLPRHPDLVILTDSKYLVDGLGKWIGRILVSVSATLPRKRVRLLAASFGSQQNMVDQEGR